MFICHYLFYTIINRFYIPFIYHFTIFVGLGLVVFISPVTLTRRTVTFHIVILLATFSDNRDTIKWYIKVSTFSSYFSCRPTWRHFRLQNLPTSCRGAGLSGCFFNPKNKFGENREDFSLIFF